MEALNRLRDIPLPVVEQIAIFTFKYVGFFLISS